MAGIALPLPRWRARSGAPTGLRAPQVSEQLVLWIGGSLLFLTAVLNFYVFQVSVVATSAYEVQALQREQDVWRGRNQQLQLEVAKARSLRWVEYSANQQLGMATGDLPIYLTVDPGNSAVNTSYTSTKSLRGDD
ncbi:MAG: hypothetical protein EXR58_00590 [Chloroflexi bacterium]|nr:hypothetical protein [Chloroflexota bacterium]